MAGCKELLVDVLQLIDETKQHSQQDVQNLKTSTQKCAIFCTPYM